MKKNYVATTKNNTGGHLEIREDWKNSNMRGHTKLLGGFDKSIGGKAFRGPVAEGCSCADNLDATTSENLTLPGRTEN